MKDLTNLSKLLLENLYELNVWFSETCPSHQEIIDWSDDLICILQYALRRPTATNDSSVDDHLETAIEELAEYISINPINCLVSEERLTTNVADLPPLTVREHYLINTVNYRLESVLER